MTHMKDEALKLALEALDDAWGYGPQRLDDKLAKAITAIKQALAAPVQEPVAWAYVNEDGECEQIEYGEPFNDPDVTLLYTTPPAAQRQWIGLTDGEISQLWIGTSPYFNEDDFARAIEAKLKEKNI